MTNTPHDRMAELPDPDRVSDDGAAVECLVEHLDADIRAAEERRRFAYVMGRLTFSQHELFALMSAGLSRDEIAHELGIAKSTLCERENALLKKICRILRQKPEPTPRFPD